MRQIYFLHSGNSGPATGWGRLAGFLAVILASLGASLPAAGQSKATTQVQLVLFAETVKPGDPVTVGIRMRMQPKEHVYWRNPGTGIPTAIAWKLPPGVTAGEIQWPVPEKMTADDLTSYIYNDEVVLLVPLKVAADAASGPLTLKGDVSWLECAIDGLCVPGKTNVAAVLTVGAETKPAAGVGLLETWRKRLPSAKTDLAAKASWEKTAVGDTRPITFEWTAGGPASDADFFPDASDDFDVLGKVETVSSGAGRIQIRKQIKKGEGNWPSKISGLLVQKTGAEPVAYEVSLPISGGSTAALSAAGKSSLLIVLLSAFLGGLILNVMPCVLPVIALKILGFVNQADEEPARVRKMGLAYGVGVLVSFVVLALVAIAVQRAGGLPSWSAAFQNPQFRVVLTVLMTLVALNLFGVFEVVLGGRVMSAASGLSSRAGYPGAFFNGVLATLLATPCTAPFLSGAVGFAFTQPASVIVLIFLGVGLGLAAPFVLLCWEPGWLKFLPKPGRWMERFKVAMGFPILVTVVWLFWVTATRMGRSGVLWLGIFLVVLAFGAWIFGEFAQRGGKHRGVAVLISLLLVAADYGLVMEGQLHWRDPTAINKDAIAWKSWSPESVAKARREGHPVLVDFTADTCWTCQINLRSSIDIKETRDKLREINAVTLTGDFTDQDPAIAKELQRFGIAGVPLVLVYPADESSPPIVLPTVLTPGIVLDALNRAAKPASASVAAKEN